MAYRQRCADLWGRPVAIPHSDETVATGAAAQAGSMLAGEELGAVQARWQLGANDMVEPQGGVDVASIRGRYAAAAD